MSINPERKKINPEKDSFYSAALKRFINCF